MKQHTHINLKPGREKKCYKMRRKKCTFCPFMAGVTLALGGHLRSTRHLTSEPVHGSYTALCASSRDNAPARYPLTCESSNRAGLTRSHNQGGAPWISSQRHTGSSSTWPTLRVWTSRRRTLRQIKQTSISRHPPRRPGQSSRSSMRTPPACGVGCVHTPRSKDTTGCRILPGSRSPYNASAYASAARRISASRDRPTSNR